MSIFPGIQQQLEKQGLRVEREAGRADTSAVLGNGQGQISLPGNPKLYYYRTVSVDIAGVTTYGAPSVALASGANLPEKDGTEIIISYWRNQPIVAGIDPVRYAGNGKNARALNPQSPYNKFVLMQYALLAYAAPIGTRETPTIEVYIKPFYYYDDEGNYHTAGDEMVEFAASIPAVDGSGNDQQLIAGLFVKPDGTFEIVTSTPKLAGDILTHDTDMTEVIASASARAMPVRSWVLITGQTLLSIADEFSDTRPWLNTMLRKNNFSAIIDPDSATDDIDAGYEAGSLWFNTIGQQIFLCTKDTSGAAVWREMGLDINHSFHGSFSTTIDFTISSDGATITGSLEADGGGDLEMFFSDHFTILDCTPACTVTLTPGTDTNPQENFVYILQSTKVLTVSTSDWPTTEHIKIANCLLRTAATTETDGALGNRNWNDQWETADNMGHILHITQRLRQEHAQYETGIAPTVTIDSIPNPDSVTVATTAGTVYQLHKQAFPFFDMTQYTIDAVSQYTIDGVNQGTKTFTISDDGDLTTLYPNGRTIKVHSSTGNDGFYTVVSTSFSAPDFDIIVSETIPDATVDGIIGDDFVISGDGDLSATFPDERRISIHGSTGNDGCYTIVGTSFSSPDFTITVTESIPSAVADGTIGDDIHIVNNFASNYVTVTDLNTQTLDSLGNTLVNKFFSFVLWGVQNRDGTTSHLMLNLPSGSYNQEADAVADILNHSVFDIPKIFKGLGFLIARFTFRLTAAASGTWTLEDTEDLRDRTPNTTAGAGGGGAGVTDFLGLSDTPSSYIGQSGKVPKVNALETALEFGAAGGSLEFIEEKTFVSAATTTTFSGLTGTDSYFFIMRIVNDAGIAANYAMRINGDANSNDYVTQQLSAAAAVVAATRVANAANIAFCTPGDAMFTTGYCGLSDGRFFASAIPSFYSGADILSYLLRTIAKNTAGVGSISQIEIIADQANGIGVDSVISLWKVVT